MILFSFLMMPKTIVVYLLPLAYPILQQTRNPAKLPKTVVVYSKSLPFVLPASYLLL